MLPTLIDFGFFAIRGYGLMIGLGALVSAWLVRKEARAQGFERFSEKLESLVVLIAGGAFVGGKLFYVVFHYPRFREALNDGIGSAIAQGFVFYGSIVVCVPLVRWFLKRNELPVMKTMDFLALGAPVAHGFGRIGCFLAGCCYGCRTHSPLAVRFHEGIGLNGVWIHPVQLYEAGGLFLIYAVLRYWIRRPQRATGQVLGLYLCLYALLRFGTEMVRGDGNPVFFDGSSPQALSGTPPPGLTLAQITSFVMLPIGVGLFLRARRRKGRGEDTP